MAVTPLRDEYESPRALPTNPAVEQRLLGAILCDNKAYRRVARIVDPEHFANAIHQRIWAEITRLIHAGIEASPLTLASAFEGDQALEGLGGGAKYLARLACCAVTITGAEDYAKEVARLAGQRELIAVLADALDGAYGAADELGARPQDILAEVQTRIGKIREGDWRSYGLEIHNAGALDPTKIPPREWLLGTTFCRKFLSGLVGAGGDGKTAIRYVQYLAVATGRKLTAEHVHHRGRVLVVCLEDHLAEVERRISAAMLYHRINPAELDGRLFYSTPRGLKLLIVDGIGKQTVGPLYCELRHAITVFNIDLVGVDPFIKSHGAEENDNGAIDEVCTLLAALADEFNCATDVVHHTRKGAASPGDADRSRGASALVDSGRLVRTITRMSEAEAETFGIASSERASLIRVDDAKVNLVPRSADATWFRFVGVPLGNGKELFPHGDNVQTVERWTPPDMWRELTTTTTNQILDRIEQGPTEGQRYSPAPQAKDRAAWPLVQEACPKLTENQAKEVIKTWIKTGILISKPFEDPKDRHKKPGLFVGKRPGDTWEVSS